MGGPSQLTIHSSPPVVVIEANRRTREWSADEDMPLIRRQPGHETSRNADVDRASGGCPYTRRMSVPPPNGRRPVMAAVAIVLIFGLVLLFIVAM